MAGEREEAWQELDMEKGERRKERAKPRGRRKGQKQRMERADGPLWEKIDHSKAVSYTHLRAHETSAHL
eukprot:937608-Alexandrium_andersonii.AAC.1